MESSLSIHWPHLILQVASLGFILIVKKLGLTHYENMKTSLIALATCLILSACSDRETISLAAPNADPVTPLQKGELISVDLLNKPYPEYSPSSISWKTIQGGEVEIYEGFIIATTGEGVSHLALHNWYKDLKFHKILAGQDLN